LKLLTPGTAPTGGMVLGVEVVAVLIALAREPR
jgi:hypothetical protein